MICPICHEKTHLQDKGWTRGRHIFVCSKCETWLEEIITLRALPVAIKRLIQGG